MNKDDLYPLHYYSSKLVEKISQAFFEKVKSEPPKKQEKTTLHFEFIGDEVDDWYSSKDEYEDDPRFEIFEYEEDEKNNLAYQEVEISFTPLPDLKDPDVVAFILKDSNSIGSWYDDRKLEALIRDGYIGVSTMDSFIREVKMSLFDYDAWAEGYDNLDTLDICEEQETRELWLQAVNTFFSEFNVKNLEEFEKKLTEDDDLPGYAMFDGSVIWAQELYFYKLGSESIVISFANTDHIYSTLKFY